MTTGPLQRFTRFFFATALSRELTWALLVKLTALGLIGWIFFGDSAPPATAQAVDRHILRTPAPGTPPGASSYQGEP